MQGVPRTQGKKMEVTARALGKIILAVEHAVVVHESTAVAASIDLCTYVSLRTAAPSGVVSDIFNASQFWKSRKYLQPNCWLQSSLRREIQALMQEEDVDIIVHHILGVIDSFVSQNEPKSHVKIPETKEEEFKALVSDAASPFLGARTNRFVNELDLFLASGLNIEAHDAVYMQRLGWSFPGATSEASEGAISGQTAVIPYLYIFDAESDGPD